MWDNKKTLLLDKLFNIFSKLISWNTGSDSFKISSNKFLSFSLHSADASLADILKNYADRVQNLGDDSSRIRNTRLKKLDLTGLLINTTITKILHERFVFEEFLLGNSKQDFDEAFAKTDTELNSY